MLDQTVGQDKISAPQVEKVAVDLANNPPVKFDVARKVRVFNAAFEFVEFELRGYAISRKSVHIPSDLMGLAQDPKTQRLLRSSFQLIDNEDKELSGKNVAKLKQWIIDTYLIQLPKYGTVIRREVKSEFLSAIETLRRYTARFQKRVESRLQKAIDDNRTTLVNALLPAVIENPPPRWKKYLGPQPGRDNIRKFLDSELQKQFGTAKELIDRMEVLVVFKGVTYESLSTPEFLEVARKAMPDLDLLEEFEAAREVTSPQTKVPLSNN
jgi:hypothetical protein